MTFSRETTNLLKRVEQITGSPVEIEFDPSFGPFEGVSRVAGSETQTHRLIVRDSTQESVIWHEIGHIERMMWTPTHQRNVVFLTPKAIEDMVDLGLGEILNGIVGHIHRTVRNTVPDILIESRIQRMAPPSVTEQQAQSFLATQHSQVSSCITLTHSPHYRGMKPFVILLGAYARFGARLTNLDDATDDHHLWTQADEFLQRLQEASPNHEGEDGEFTQRWLSDRNLGSWFLWEPITYDLPYAPAKTLLSLNDD